MPIRAVYCQEVVFGRRETLCIPDTLRHPLRHQVWELGVRAYLGVPILLSDGTLYGTLCATHRSAYPYSPQEIEIMEIAAKFIGLLLDMERLAIRDGLTGVYNRSFLEHHIRYRVVELGPVWGLVLVDVDNFKQINDRYGHDTGDLILRVVAQRVLRCVREDDLVVRVGGDEFAVYLPNAEGDAGGWVRTVAERIAHSAAEPLRVGDLWLRLTVSAGWAWCPEDGEEERQVYRMADQRLMGQKGRRGQQAQDA